MSNLNINRTGNDPSDNVIRRYSEQPINYREVGYLISMIIAGALVAWIVLFTIMKIECYWTCGYTQYIFIGYNVFLAIIATAITVYVVQWVINSGYLSFRGIKVSRKDARLHADKILDIGKISAESEATAGIDTWSPTTHSSSNSTNIPPLSIPDENESLVDEIDFAALMRKPK